MTMNHTILNHFNSHHSYKDLVFTYVRAGRHKELQKADSLDSELLDLFFSWHLVYFQILFLYLCAVAAEARIG